MKQSLTNEEILRMAQARIIERGQNPYYPAEQHLKDTDLLMELSELIRKYKQFGNFWKKLDDNWLCCYALHNHRMQAQESG